MHTAKATLTGVSPLSQSGFFKSEKPDKETHDAFERRCWREKMHTTEAGEVFIPPAAFKFAVAKAAEMLSIKIPGGGQAKYTKNFKSGVLVLAAPIIKGAKADDFRGEWINANSDGRRGSGKRVARCFPTVDKWEVDVEFLILDDVITEDIFRRVLEESGKFVGVGMHRPENGGYKGRYQVTAFEWKGGAA